MNTLSRQERGFTLVELLVVIPIAALVVFAATAVIIQLLRSNDVNAETLAMRQAQFVGDWISRDGLQAQSVEIRDDVNEEGGFLYLRWTGWDDNKINEVSYSLTPMAAGSNLHQMERRHSVDGVVSTIVVGRFLDGSSMSCSWKEGERVFNIKVVVQIGDTVKHREYDIKPRPLV